MPAGELRHLVQLQKPTYTTDDAGVVYRSGWTTISTVWANVEPLSDSMIAQASQAIGTLSHRITIRCDTRVQHGWRVLWGSREFEIVGPPRNIEERNVWMELRCSEVVS